MLLEYKDLLSDAKLDLHDLCSTLQMRKERFKHKLSIVVISIDDLKEKIAYLCDLKELSDIDRDEIIYSGSTHPIAIANHSLAQFVRAYHQDEEVNWQSLYDAIVNISHQLPVYPFDTTPCLIPNAEKSNSLTDSTWLHKLDWQEAKLSTIDFGLDPDILFVNDDENVPDEIVTNLKAIDLNYQVSHPDTISSLTFSHLILLLNFSEQTNDIEKTVVKSLGVIVRLAQQVKHHDIKFSIVVLNTHDGIKTSIYNATAGLIKALQGELANIKFKFIQYHASAGYDLLITELLSSDNLLEVCLKDKKRLIPSIQPLQINQYSKRIRSHGCYVITGGSGGLAKVVAEWLIKKYSAKVILISRKPLTAFSENIHIISADISDKNQFDIALQKARAIAPINGIFHLAGYAKSEPLQNKTWQTMQDTIKPKVYSTIYLDELTRSDKLDFIVLFSSIASLLGNAYQGDYSFANEFLNQFASASSSPERPIISINWGTWYETGMMQEQINSSEYYRTHYQQFISNSLGIECLEKCLQLNLSSIIVASEWQLHPEQQTSAIEKTKTKSVTLNDIQQMLINSVAEKCGIDASQCDIERPFLELGIDSITAVDLVMRLNKLTGKNFKPTLLFDQHNILNLSTYVSQDLPTVSSQSTVKTTIKPIPKELPQTLDDNKDIAIIGIACEFPGAKNIDEFWNRLVNKDNFITEIPEQYSEILNHYSTDADELGTTYSKWGGYLPSLDDFDYAFFNISKAEANEMDAQQKLALRLSWSVLESASYVNSLRNKNVGVYIGTMTTPFRDAQHAKMTAKTLLSNSNAILANRLSYFHSFSGPSLMIDTLCSSSLVALDMAVNALRQGRCHYAMVGGIRVGIPLEHYVGASRMKVLSPQGRCASFSEGADGFVPGEGGVMLLLKPLREALSSGDKIWAVIKGTAVNHCGYANGMTAPNPQAQSQLIRMALQDANLSASDISYMEAHGTGTELGDPIEISGLTDAYRKDSTINQFCGLGSVKTNIGHTEPVAGLAGVAKVVLALNKNYIPANLHLSEPNRHIEFSETPFYLIDQGKSWPVKATGKRYAGVSSFGIGGTNAHVILEEGIRTVQQEETNLPQLILVSARSAEALQQHKNNIMHFIANEPEQRLLDIAFSLAVERKHFAHRYAKIVNHKDESSYAGIVTSKPKVGFLFTGQGSQYLGMGKQLFEYAPVFREKLLYCETLLKDYLSKPLTKVLWEDAEALKQTRQTQPCLFALEYSLCEQLKEWGIVADFVIGHSLGEYVAACVAGVMDVETGMKQIILRARLMDERIKQPSGMLAIMSNETEVTACIEVSNIRVDISGINNPQLVTVAGCNTEIQQFSKYLSEKQIKHLRLDVSHGFHSYVLEPMLDEFEQGLVDFHYRKSTIPLISNVTGNVMTDIPGAKYWREHVRKPVRYMQGIQTLRELGCDVFIEIGPDAVMIGMGKKVITDHDVHWVPSLTRGKDDIISIMQMLAQLHVLGVNINWNKVYQDKNPLRVSLPLYPFENKSEGKKMLEPTIKYISTGSVDRNAFRKKSSASMLEVKPSLPIANLNQSKDNIIKNIIANTLQIELADLPLEVPLLELGADSLILSSAISSLNKQFTQQITMRQIFSEIKTTSDVINYFN